MNLRILFVEDSADDVALMLGRLRKAGIEAQWQRVETAAALRETLVDGPWQVALVDYNLPGFGGLEALAVLAEVAPDLPAITVSGAISEETAVATISAGAVDYVLKENLTRLAPAVRRTVEGAELRGRQRRAATQARQTQFAIDHSSQAIVYVSEGGVILYANAAAGRLGGVPTAEAVGEKIWGWSSAVDEERWSELWRAAARAPIVDFKAAVRLPGGEQRLISATLDYHEHDEDSFVIVYARDITAQRAVEERARAGEERYRRLTDNATDIIFRYDLFPTVRLSYINPAVEAITGYTPDELYADPQIMLDIVDPQDVALVRRMIQFPPLPDERLLMRWIVKDGVTRWMESRVVPVCDAEGRLQAVEGITRDITERRQTEEALRRSETLLRTLVDTLPDLVWLKDPEGVYLSCNRRFESFFGAPEQDIVGKSDSDFMDEDLADFFRQRDKAAMAAGGPTVNEEEIVFADDGHREVLETIKTPIHASDGRLIGVLGVGRDITARKRAEEELKASEARLAAAQAVAKVGSWETDLVDLSVIWSEETYRIFEIDPDSFHSSHPSFLEFVHPEDRAQTDAALAQSFDSRSLNAIEHRIVTPGGLVKSVEERWRILRDDQGQPVRAVGTCQDITARKQAEEALRQSEERFRRVSEATSDFAFSCVKPPGGSFAFDWLTGAVEGITGWSRDALFEWGGWKALVLEEDVPLFEERVIGLAPGESGVCELRIRDKRGGVRWLAAFSTAEHDAHDPAVHRLHGACRDITERRRAEEAQRESEEKYRLAMEATRDGLWDWSIPTNEVFYSPGWKRILALHDELSDYDAWASRVHPEDRQAMLDSLTRHLEGLTEQWEQEHRLRTGDGEWKWVLGRGTVVARDAEGKPLRMVGTMTDIAERRQAEDEILRQAEQLRLTVEGAVLAMSNVVETRDPYTAGHERRVSELATAIAAEMGINGEALVALRLGGLIHDIGKIAVPAEILSKPGLLSEVELNLIKQHPASGFDILAAIDFGLPVAEVVLQHHERQDGSGYPRALAGDEILPEARILAVADVVEAMSSHRPYRAALGMEAALAEIRAHAGVKYDADVVAACVRLVEEQSFAFTP